MGVMHKGGGGVYQIDQTEWPRERSEKFRVQIRLGQLLLIRNRYGMDCAVAMVTNKKIV